MKWPQRWIWSGVALGALIGLLVWLQGGLVTKVAPGRSPITYSSVVGTVVIAEEKKLPRLLRWPGVIQAAATARIAPKIAGQILTLVKLGDVVHQGQELARLDDKEIRARLQAARAELAAVQAEAERARTEAIRLRRLFAQEATTKRDLEQAEAAFRAASARVQEAQHQIEVAQAQLAETRLVAPFSGKVSARWANPGDMAIPGQAILSLDNPNRLETRSHIPEQCGYSLSLGTPLTVEVPAAGKRLQVEVSEISAAADPLSHTLEIKAQLMAQPNILPGAFAWVEQACGEETLLLIPAMAVRRLGQLEEVWLARPGEAVQTRLIRTGRRVGEQVEVLAGLEVGDPVLVPEER
ncbi:MAG: efflux RND transporter periplasmic adaptor subunit [Methylohalobius sp.]|nr:efflux RND transporter periplasmic adaptor subunit [Methylohalobius sp.]